MWARVRSVAVGAPQEAVEALHGVVSAMPDGGETRTGQDEMCEAVASALDQDRHLVVAAGTGTGKSMAYLAPRVSSGKKTVVVIPLISCVLRKSQHTSDLPRRRLPKRKTATSLAIGLAF